MGCSDSKDLKIEPWTGSDLRKEPYLGVESKATASVNKQTNYYAKYKEWRGQQIISRSDYKDFRAMMDVEQAKPNDDKRSKVWIDQCSCEETTVKGPDGNDLKMWVIKALKNKDEKDLVPVVNFHGGGAWCGHPLQDKWLASRICVENRTCFFLVSFRLAPEFEYPTHVKDGMASVDFVYDNCEKYGCDKTKLIATGESGGSWMTMGTSIWMLR